MHSKIQRLTIFNFQSINNEIQLNMRVKAECKGHPENILNKKLSKNYDVAEKY